MRRQVLLNFSAGTWFGWGIVGLNLLQQWAADRDIQPLMGLPIGPRDTAGLDPLRLGTVAPAVASSNQFLDELRTGAVNLTQREILVVDALGNGFGAPAQPHIGLRNVGRCIFEDTRLINASQQLQRYDSLLCASHWNGDLLRSATGRPVTVIHEGVDHAHFFPGPRSGLLNPGRFYVFSGGKVEFRKGHDLLLLAFREFAARHADAVLVGAWHSPWPQLSVGFQGRLPAPLQQSAAGTLDLQRWVTDNGVDSRQFIELPPMTNSLLPMVLREMDCAVQVSRCEACTNLPANEAMACGVPVILAANSGVRDLIDGDNCLALDSKGPVISDYDWGTDGWGEAAVEEIVESLETLYTDTRLRRAIGRRGAEWMLEQRRTWRDHAAALKVHLLGLY